MIHTIQTERLSIRRIRAEDWKDIQAIWSSAAKSVYPNMTGRTIWMMTLFKPELQT